MATSDASLAARRSTLVRGVRMLRAEVSLHPRLFATAVGGAAVYGVATVASSWALRWVIDHVILPRFEQGHVAAGAVVAGCAALVVVGLVKASGVVVRRAWAGRTQWAVMSSLRRRLGRRYLEQPGAWYQRQVSGELVAHVGVDCDAATDALGPLPYATGVVVLLATATVGLLRTDLVLGGVAVLLFPVISFVNVWYQHRVQGPAEEAQGRLGELSAAVHESLEGALLVKALGRADVEVERVRVTADRLRAAKVRTAVMRADFEALLDGVPTLTNVVLVALGARRVASGAVTIGDVTSFVYLYGLLVWPLRMIGFLLGDIPRSLAGWDRVQALLAQPVVADPLAAAADAPAGLAVVLRGVGFGYEPDRPVLDGVDLTVREGDTVAIVGRTGAGKSTLVQVIAGLLAADRGEVAVRPGARRLVFQDAFLFAGSIRDNVGLWRPLPDEEPRRSLRLAAASFVHDLPDGMDTIVGERGVTLSGGQRQRVAAARALASAPSVLLLDDVTSALDPGTEAEVLANLRRELGGLTTILVASRPSAVALADQVVHLEDGRVVGVGTHDELLESDPRYRSLLEAYARERGDAGDADDAHDGSGAVVEAVVPRA